MSTPVYDLSKLTDNYNDLYNYGDSGEDKSQEITGEGEPGENCGCGPCYISMMIEAWLDGLTDANREKILKRITAKYEGSAQKIKGSREQDDLNSNFLYLHSLNSDTADNVTTPEDVKYYLDGDNQNIFDDFNMKDASVDIKKRPKKQPKGDDKASEEALHAVPVDVDFDDIELDMDKVKDIDLDLDLI